MSIGPTVIKPNSLPFPTLGCGLIAAFFVIQAVVVAGWMTVLSLVIAAIFAAGAFWYWYQAKHSSVLIDTNQFIVKTGSKQQTFDRADIATVDLSSVGGHITFTDGTSIQLPLEGGQLVEAGLLLTPVVNDS